LKIHGSNEQILKWITASELWERFDEWRKQARRKGEISASQDRHLRRIKAYWLELPVREKRKGTTTKWLKEVVERFIKDTWKYDGELFFAPFGDEDFGGYAEDFDKLKEDLGPFVSEDEQGYWKPHPHITPVMDTEDGGIQEWWGHSEEIKDDPNEPW